MKHVPTSSNELLDTIHSVPSQVTLRPVTTASGRHFHLLGLEDGKKLVKEVAS